MDLITRELGEIRMKGIMDRVENGFEEIYTSLGARMNQNSLSSEARVFDDKEHLPSSGLKPSGAGSSNVDWFVDMVAALWWGVEEQREEKK